MQQFEAATPARGAGRDMPSLDGLRAVSIAMVIAAHLGWYPEGSWRHAFELGQLGVRIFFVISGFLITRLLLDEQRRTGHISLGAFYLRRSLRIFPPYLVFLGVVVALAWFQLLALRPGDLRAALTYTMNYHPDRAWYVGHTWSLAVEEQFYLLWPALLVLLGTRRALLVAGLGLLVAPLVRVVTLRWWPAHDVTTGESFQTVFDTLATGCVLAGLGPWLAQRPRTLARYQAFLRSPYFYAVPLVVYLCQAGRSYISFDYPLGETVRNLGIALCVDRWVRFPSDHVGRALNHPAVAAVGRMSYSLYLWQQLFLAPDPLWPALPFPLDLLCAVAVAFASYRLIEQPCQRLYHRLPVAAPPARRTLKGLGPISRAHG